MSISQLIIFKYVSEPDKNHIVNHFEDLGSVTEDEGPQFNNLVVDKNTGRVYIGAVNKLYQLSPNLERTVSFSVKSNSSLVCLINEETLLMHKTPSEEN